MLWIPCFEIFQSRRSSSLKISCGKKFLRVLIFAIFAVFPAIRKNKFPQMKIVGHTFSAKIISRVNILQLKFTTQKYSTTKSCLSWQSQLASLTQKQLNTGLLLENMYFYCTYSIKTKILSMLGTGYFLKIAKINSQQAKRICPNRKNCQSAKNKPPQKFHAHGSCVLTPSWNKKKKKETPWFNSSMLPPPENDH